MRGAKKLFAERTEKMRKSEFAVVDLFSGAGGMSFGFHRHPGFEIVAAADAELGKPSAGTGRLQCNDTYARNIGLRPVRLDLSTLRPDRLRRALGLPEERSISVLSACPPCTGFSRTNPRNHLRDDVRNSLVRRSAEFAVALSADIVVMENARELIRGNFRDHFGWFREFLESRGYGVFGGTYMLSRFGLPQIRERAIVLAAKRRFPLFTPDDLWEGWAVRQAATTVRRAFGEIPAGASGRNVFPAFSSEAVRRRMAAIPEDGGSWMDLLKTEDPDEYLTGAMKRIVAGGKFGSYPDVYGRMAWDRPAPTIKRECAHVGNGRYAHPEADRLCSVREMATLQGFPADFEFDGAAVSNMYRHIGDAVPPLISFQIAHLVHWMLTGRRPEIESVLLPETNLRHSDLRRKSARDPGVRMRAFPRTP
jgi:DNA (cytosine-5)-methyltransferase 1